MRFRADIEGLRGVAIALVVLAHAGVPGVAGGIIGVDVFFVISGFLITSLLARELRATGSIDYWDFYARRAKRLIPALLVMLAVVGVLASVLLPHSLLPLQATTGMLAALWVSNFYFAFQKLDYFATDASSSLYLHTWSLGVEEQFYLVWPLLLVTAWGGVAARGRAGIATVVGVVTAFGFLVAVVAHGFAPVAAYYLMPTRLWELGLGGLVALLAARPLPADPALEGRLLEHPGRAEWLRASGIGIMVLGAMVVQPGTPHLFAWLLLPAGGAALVLFARGEESRPLFRLFASRPLRFLGRVSYAFYLWHWPLLGLARATLGDRPLPVALAVAAALACAWLSTAWLEEPVRRWNWSSRKGQVAFGVLASLALVVAHQGWTSSIRREATLRRAPWTALLNQQFSGPTLYKLGCDRTFKSAELIPCVIADPGQPTQRVLLLGDSVAAQWTPALEEIARRRGWQLITLTKAGCPIVDIRIHYPRIGREYFECAQWRDRAVEYIKRTRFDLIVIGSASRYKLTTDQWVSGTRSFLSRTRGAAPDFALLDPTPTLPFNPLDCLLSLDGPAADQSPCTVALNRARSPGTLSALRQAAAPFPDVRNVSLDALVCPDARCTVLRDGQVVYRDEVHLHVPFVRGLAEGFEAALVAQVAASADPHLAR